MSSQSVRFAAFASAVFFLGATAAQAASNVAQGGPPMIAQGGPNSDSPIPIVRGGRVSGVVRHQVKPPSGGGGGGASVCSNPGGAAGNYKTNCHGSGRPVNETWIATNANGSMLAAGANDYNSYNGQGQDGFYWSSTCGTSWNDAGPIDVFPHTRPAQYDAAGDPGLAFDTVDPNLVYYSSLFFNFTSCKVGGVELLRGTYDSGTKKWSWKYFQVAANSSSQFQDKPAVAADGSHVYVSWTQFGSCSGSNVPSPIMVAVFPTGSSSVAPTLTFAIPGSTYSQGSSIAADGTGNGFWIAWEEYPNAAASTGLGIFVSHCTATGSCDSLQRISLPTFVDLPSPLPGFSFRTDSFPALTMVAGSPEVVWTSADTGVGRAYLCAGTCLQGTSSPQLISDSGDDQFFPAIAANGSDVFVSYGQTSKTNGTYDTYLWNGTASKVSSASSAPDADAFFSGQFIGDYNGMSVLSCGSLTSPAHPMWTDIRGTDPNYPGYEMDGMVYAK